MYFADHGAPGAHAAPASCDDFLTVQWSPRVLRRPHFSQPQLDMLSVWPAGILGMPSGEFLYADQLIGTLRNKSEAKYVPPDITSWLVWLFGSMLPAL